MTRSLAVLAVFAFVAPPASAKCAMMGLGAEVITPAAAVIPADGGIIVAAVDVQGGALDKGDVAVQAGWRFRSGATAVAPKIETLAPGLARYSFAAAKTLQLERADKKVVAKFTVSTDKRALLAAPKVRRITHASGQGRRPFTHIIVELDGTPPAGALAIVLADDKGTPRSWGRIEADRPVMAYDLTRCRVKANGTIVSSPGDKVTVFWVDDAGRKSPASKPFVIAGTPNTKPDDD